MLDSSRLLGHVAMYDLRYLREHFNGIREQLGSRGRDIPWDELHKLLDERRGLSMQVEELRADLNKGSEAVARLKRQQQPADEETAAWDAWAGVTDGYDRTARSGLPCSTPRGFATW